MPIQLPRLVLASASPRRAELLRSAGFDFAVRPANEDESVLPDEAPAAYALRVATAKADRVARDAHEPDEVVLAADTVVVAAGWMMGKPVDADEAASMLRRLAGSVHEVITAVVLLHGLTRRSEVVTARVHFLPMSEQEIIWYVSTGEPMGKAGAYAIQGRGARFVEKIEGSWSTVVGLPVATVYRLLRELTDQPV
jgi:septum formation protein